MAEIKKFEKGDIIRFNDLQENFTVLEEKISEGGGGSSSDKFVINLEIDTFDPSENEEIQVISCSVSKEQIEEYVKIAEEGGMTVEEVKKHYEDPRSKEYLIDDAKENKLFDELYKEIKVSKGFYTHSHNEFELLIKDEG